MKVNIYLILTLCSLIYGCDIKKEEQDILKKHSIIIAGKIDSVKSKTVSIAFSDIIRESEVYTQILDTVNGVFHFKFDIFHSQDIRFSYNNKHLKLFIEPSDSLFITFDSKDFDKGSDNKFSSVKFFGNNILMNEELLKFSVYSKVPAFTPNAGGKSVKLYHYELGEQIKNEKAELAEFVSLQKPSSKFVEWAKNDIIFSNANYLINYKAYLFYSNLPRNDSLFETNLFPINDKNSLMSSLFGVHLWHYVTDKYIQNDTLVMEYLSNENYLDTYNKCISNVLENEPIGVIRDIMVYKLLSALYDESFDDFKTVWVDKNNMLANQLLITEMDSRIEQTENEKDFSIAFLEDLSNEESEFLGDIFNEILNQSKDKLIYLDIWATWCGPCRAEFPYTIALHYKLVNEEIEFISLCCGSNRTLWQDIINENNLPGKHYFLDKSQTDILRARLKFDGFPTYMIIKDGEILNKQAPRPSSGDRIIDELLQDTR